MRAVPIVGRSAQNPGKKLLGLTAINEIANRNNHRKELIWAFSSTNFLRNDFLGSCESKIEIKNPTKNSQKRVKGKKNAALASV